MDIGARIHVRGMVQGVGFRYFVHAHAAALGVVGFVSNLNNGDVVIEAEADRSVIEQLVKEVNVGPRSARVTGVSVEWKTPQYCYKTFEIR